MSTAGKKMCIRDRYEISIVQISPDEGALEEWKEIHRDTIDTEKMQDENVVFEVKVKS